MNKYLQGDYPTVEFFYSHWGKLQDIQFEQEITKLSQYIKENNITNYSIVAKSAGFVLSLQGTARYMLTPKTIVGYGLPIEYSMYRNIDLKSLITLSSTKSNIICIQADNDPQGSLNHTKDIVLGTCPIWEIKDNTHNYDKFKQMARIAKSFIVQHQ